MSDMERGDWIDVEELRLIVMGAKAGKSLTVSIPLSLLNQVLDAWDRKSCFHEQKKLIEDNGETALVACIKCEAVLAATQSPAVITEMIH